MKFVGLDAGSVSVKVVVTDKDGKKIYGEYRRHEGHPLRVANELLAKATKEKGDYSLAVTGSAGRLIASIFGIEPINEIVAQSYSIRKFYPHIKTVIELGGEDSKLILIEDGVKDFAMNSVCAAGTGSFLDQQAERLVLSIEEFGQMSLKCEKPPRIAGRCSVFAKSDMIHLQQIATPVEDIVAGLCFAVARNFKGSIAKGRTIKKPVAFQGGVAANPGMVRAFKEVFELDELFVPPDFAIMGAWGAALKAIDENKIHIFNPSAIEDFLKSDKNEHKGHKPLMVKGDKFMERHGGDKHKLHPTDSSVKIPTYMGIDIGSISTNVAIIDEEGRLFAKRYLMTAGRPIEAVRRGLREVFEEVGDRIDVKGVATTGSGRYMIADFVGADVVKNEITAQATAAAFIDKNVDTIFEIGGQDSKFISMRDGVIVDFEMNKACAAGTGSFLEEQADKLNISVKDEFAKYACSSCNPLRLGERCTVFMENSLMANLQKGSDKEDLLSGLAYSIVQNYINRVVSGKHIGNHIFFQGGVAFNKAVVAAFEKYVGKEVTVPPHHDVTGAIGMALIAMRQMQGKNIPTAFKGFELSSRNYAISTFECKGCENLCEINRVKIEGDKDYLFYGGRCEKYDIKKKKSENLFPDLFAFREKALWNAVDAEPDTDAKKPLIGIPNIFFFHDQLPFWVTMLKGLGFRVEVSPQTSRNIIGLGVENVLSESCFPVKVSHGHIKYLVDKGVDAVFIPSFININKKGEEFDRGAACPYTQTIPYMAKVAIPGLKSISPVINLSLGKSHIVKEVAESFKSFGVNKSLAEKAFKKAEEAQFAFEKTIKDKGNEVLLSLGNMGVEKAVVIVGRSYNAFARGMNLDIPEKLASLGILSFPMDMLPIEKIEIKEDWPNMYWRSGQRILKAARYVERHPKLYPIFIGNFSCGPDSFILKYFKKDLGTKPFLHLEIDEHSADAGAITRCEAFLDSIDGLLTTRSKDVVKSDETKGVAKVSGHKIHKRTIYIPRMCDHAFALKAAFESCGVPCEVLPESDKEALETGMRFVSGKECYPCAVTTGDMLKKVFSPGFKPEESAFFMPSGSGPCRFGQYNVFHNHVLESAGVKDVMVFAPNQDEGFYTDLGIVSKDFSATAWKGIIAIDILTKCLHETRPYEKTKGSSDELYQDGLMKVYNSIKTGNSNGNVEKALGEIRRDFEGVARYKEERPLIGVIGEIFVRTNKFSNEDLVRKIESLGGEVWLAPFDEWVYYINAMAQRAAFQKRNYYESINIFLERLYQKKIDKKYARHFEGFLKTLHEPSTKQVLHKASPYVHDSFEGETVLSIGKAVDFAEHGACGIVNAMPFGCMPGTIVTALMRAITNDFDMPAISIPYDGTESQTTQIQIEAFMDQAKTKMAGKTIKKH